MSSKAAEIHRWHVKALDRLAALRDLRARHYDAVAAHLLAPRFRTFLHWLNIRQPITNDMAQMLDDIERAREVMQ